MLGLALGRSSISLGLWFSRAELLSEEQEEGRAVQALQAEALLHGKPVSSGCQFSTSHQFC